MPNDRDLPNRFAKIVINELADIKATVMTTSMFLLADTAKRSGGTNAQASRTFESHRKRFAKQISRELLRQLRIGD